MENTLKNREISERSTAQVQLEIREFWVQREVRQWGRPWRRKDKALLYIKPSYGLSLPLSMALAVHLAASFEGEQGPPLSSKWFPFITATYHEAKWELLVHAICIKQHLEVKQNAEIDRNQNQWSWNETEVLTWLKEKTSLTSVVVCVVSWGPFQPELFYDPVILWLLNLLWKQVFFYPYKWTFHLSL